MATGRVICGMESGRGYLVYAEQRFCGHIYQHPMGLQTMSRLQAITTETVKRMRLSGGRKPDSGICFRATLPGSYTALQWGLETDRALPGDYDGDGKTDIAVWRPGTGTWYILPSGASPGTYISTPWGLESDTPAPADYDGDGKTDIAVYRPGTGTW